MTEAEYTQTIELDRDLPEHCSYVDALLTRSLKKGKCSRLLRNQLVVFSANIGMGGKAGSDWFDPNGVCQAMAVLEGVTRGDITKGPSAFTKGPLLGLEYKHFFQASFMAQNLLNESERDKEAAIYRKFAKYYGSGDARNGQPLTTTDLNLIVDAVVTDAYERRGGQGCDGIRPRIQPLPPRSASAYAGLLLRSLDRPRLEARGDHACSPVEGYGNAIPTTFNYAAPTPPVVCEKGGIGAGALEEVAKEVIKVRAIVVTGRAGGVVAQPHWTGVDHAPTTAPSEHPSPPLTLHP